MGESGAKAEFAILSCYPANFLGTIFLFVFILSLLSIFIRRKFQPNGFTARLALWLPMGISFFLLSFLSGVCVCENYENQRVKQFWK